MVVIMMKAIPPITDPIMIAVLFIPEFVIFEFTCTF